MKYYSEKTNKYYDSEKSCLDAEEQYNKDHALEIKAKEEKRHDAQEVEAAYKHLIEVEQQAKEMVEKANKEYEDKRNSFVKKHGSYHYTYVTGDTGLLDWIFNNRFLF